MARYLVTGGAGFIGSHVARALLARGHAVRVLDDLSSGKRRSVPRGARLAVGDVRDADAVRRAMRGVDGCFHLAAIASVERSVQDPAGTRAVNVDGTRAVLAAAEAAGAPVVYASSAAVYGDNDRLPLRERERPRPLSPYAEHKLQNELDAASARARGLPTVGLRFFNVYGPGQDPASPYSGVISIFAERLLRARPLTLYGDGNQTRDFIYVRDVAAMLLRAMTRVRRLPPVLNVCTGRTTSLVQLIDALEQASGRVAEVQRAPPRAADIRHSRGSSASATRALGLRATTPLRRGLEDLLASL